MAPYPDPSELIGETVRIESRGREFIVLVVGASTRGGISAKYESNNNVMTSRHFNWDDIDELEIL